LRKCAGAHNALRMNIAGAREPKVHSPTKTMLSSPNSDNTETVVLVRQPPTRSSSVTAWNLKNIIKTGGKKTYRAGPAADVVHAANGCCGEPREPGSTEAETVYSPHARRSR
jgi:hypothetical protein